MRIHRMAVFGCAALLAVGIAACGDSGNEGNSSDEGNKPAAEAPKGNADTYILGTTDKVVSLDPAGAYDLGSQQLIGKKVWTK